MKNEVDEGECVAVSDRSNALIEMIQEVGGNGYGIKVAIVDGAIDCGHPLLINANIVFPEGGKDITTHGTAVASLIVGEAIGLARKVEVYSLPVFTENEHGITKGCSEQNIAKAINKAISLNCDVINISGASTSINGLGCDELKKAVLECEDKGITIIAATGNDGQNTESLPASLPSVIAVGACDSHGRPASFNNYGLKLRKKTLLASGVDMPVALPQSMVARLSGSSFAAPIVSAIAALVLAALELNIKNSSRSKIVREILFRTASQVHHRYSSSNKPSEKETTYKLNISALLSEVLQELHRRKRKSPTKRKSNMKDTTFNEEAVQPQSEEALPESAIVPAEDNMAGGEDLNGRAKNHTLQLPTINDSAPNTEVHVAPSLVQPQGSDAVSLRSADKVFLVGTIDYDFGTEARLDYFTQEMSNGKGHPFDPVEMASFLSDGDHVEKSNALIWTLKIDGIPVYSIEPDNQFAVLQYIRLVKFLYDQEKEGVERVSVAGVITGETRLFNGQIVPRISPVLRGMFNWTSKALAQAVIDDGKMDSPSTEQLSNFLNRIYYELRNRGTSSQERAINYAATNAYQMKEIFDDAFSEQLVLNNISAELSPVSRPDSDCWDVVLEFFNPKERLTSARKLYRYTIDVSDVIPVTVGALRSWNAY